jgi:hypothetical protein
MSNLQYDHIFWRQRIPELEKGLSLEARFHLIFSLILYLGVAVRPLIQWMFNTNVLSVYRSVSVFMGHFESRNTVEEQFAPVMLFGLWRDKARWPRAQKDIQAMTIPCAHELVLLDSNSLITSPELQIKPKTLMIEQLRNLLHPQKLIELFKNLAPFVWGILLTFCASPSNYRRCQAAAAAAADADEDEPMPGAEDVSTEDTETEDGGDEDWGDDLNLESGEADQDAVPRIGHGSTQGLHAILSL